jgi:hypothetical protein
VPPGYYDDNDPALVYQGAWTKASAIHGPDRDTRAFAKDAPASVSMAFEGGTVYYMFGKGPNYGIASVSIDGVEQKPVDQYAKDVEWLYKYRYCCFGPGRHVIVIRSSGAKNPDSSGYALDVDSISIAN